MTGFREYDSGFVGTDESEGNGEAEDEDGSDADDETEDDDSDYKPRGSARAKGVAAAQLAGLCAIASCSVVCCGW